MPCLISFPTHPAVLSCSYGSAMGAAIDGAARVPYHLDLVYKSGAAAFYLFQARKISLIQELCGNGDIARQHDVPPPQQEYFFLPSKVRGRCCCRGQGMFAYSTQHLSVRFGCMQVIN